MYEQLTLNDIKFVIDRLNLGIKKSQRKSLLLDMLDNELSQNPELVFDMLSDSEISIVRRLLKGERIIGASNVLEEIYLLPYLGWIAVRELKYKEDYSVCELVLPTEAEELLRPLIEKRKETLESRIFSFVQGWGALCGMLQLHEVVDYLRSQKGFEKINAGMVRQSIEKYSIGFELAFYEDMLPGQNEFCFSPWHKVIYNPEQVDFYRENHHGKEVIVCDERPKRFSFNEIMTASSPMFSPATPNKGERKKLIKVCHKAGLDDLATECLLLDCWMIKQTKDSPLNYFGILGKYFNSYELMAKEGMEAITNYMNTLPFWKFMGASSYEKFVETQAKATQPPRITIGPNLQAMGFDIPDDLRKALDEAFKERFKSKNSKE